VALAAVVVVSLVAFASLGGVGFAQSAVGLAQYQYGKKVAICHKGKHTITVSVRAWPAHKRHGDVLGTCAATTKKHAAKKHAEKVHAAKKHAEEVHAAKKHAEVVGTAPSVAPTAKGNGNGHAKGNGNDQSGKDHGGKQKD
jgi:hypothetical protein